MTKVVIGARIGKPAAQVVEELADTFPGVEFVAAETAEEQKAAIRDADVFVGQPARDVFLAAKKLRWIHVPGTGIEGTVGTPEVVQSSVIVTNARGPHTYPMADHVFAMMLTFAHRLREEWEDQRARRWDTRKYDQRILELGGTKLGIVALGGIGSEVAKRGVGFGMEVYAVDVRPVKPPAGVRAVWGLERLDEMMRLADWFVVTAPYTPQSKGMIDRRRLGLLKPSAHLILVSRGGIVDESALIEALQAGRIAGAGLDVFEKEPLPPDSPLWSMPNVIISPHASALTPEMWEGRRQILKDNLRRFLKGEPFPYVCDKRAGF